MDMQNEMELKQEYLDTMRKTKEWFLEQGRKYHAEHPEKFKHHIKLHKIKK